MQPQLRPRYDLAELFKRTIAARHRDECIGKLGHLCFSLVHGVHDDQLRDIGVRKFTGDQSLRNHTDHLSSTLHDSVRNNSHQTDVAAAVDQTNPTAKQYLTYRTGGISIRGASAGAGATEYANASHGTPCHFAMRPP